MDLDHVSGTTTAFYTLHSCDGEMAMKISEILFQQGEQREVSWNSLLSNNPSLKLRLSEQGLEQPFELARYLGTMQCCYFCAQ